MSEKWRYPQPYGRQQIENMYLAVLLGNQGTNILEDGQIQRKRPVYTFSGLYFDGTH